MPRRRERLRIERNQYTDPPNFVLLAKTTMVSVLAQERILGAALGGIFMSVIVFQQRRCIYSSISNTQSHSQVQSELTVPVFGRKTRSEFVHLWNQAVDKTLEPVIASLSSHGW